jgi:hypothetical protein
LMIVVGPAGFPLRVVIPASIACLYSKARESQLDSQQVGRPVEGLT